MGSFGPQFHWACLIEYLSTRLQIHNSYSSLPSSQKSAASELVKSFEYWLLIGWDGELSNTKNNKWMIKDIKALCSDHIADSKELAARCWWFLRLFLCLLAPKISTIWEKKTPINLPYLGFLATWTQFSVLRMWADSRKWICALISLFAALPLKACAQKMHWS